jgi:methionyl-tRNA formyltransferase
LPYETNGELFERISQLGAEAIIKALELIESGKAVFTPQDESLVTFSGKITAEMEQIDWTKSSTDLINLVRALNPSPVAWTTWGGKRLKIHALRPCEMDFVGVPGQVVQCTKKTVAIMCGDGKAVHITRLQAENSKAMDINAFLCGKKFAIGEILGE